MSKRQLLIVLGVWIIVINFLGFPPAWRQVLLIASGALIITIASAMKPTQRPPVKGTAPFVDHRSPGSPITNTDDKIAS